MEQIDIEKNKLHNQDNYKDQPLYNQNPHYDNNHQHNYNHNNNQTPNHTTIVVHENEKSSACCHPFCWIGIGVACFVDLFGFLCLLCIDKKRDRSQYCKGVCIGVLINIAVVVIIILIWYFAVFSAAKKILEDSSGSS